MASWLFGDDAPSLSREIFHEDSEGFVVQKQQDVEPILEQNRADMNAVSDYRPYAGKDMVKFASVPISVVEDMIRKYGPEWQHDMEAQKKWIMDKDQEAFRSHPGKL